jgi:hypothetical protein
MINNFSKIINNPRSVQYIIIFYLLISLLFSLCYHFVIPLIEGIPTLEYNKSVNGKEYVNNFFDCFYFSITSQTTVGYGDIVPSSFSGKLLTMIQVVFGFFYLAFTISFFTARAVLKSDKFEAFMSSYSNNRINSRPGKEVH